MRLIDKIKQSFIKIGYGGRRVYVRPMTHIAVSAADAVSGDMQDVLETGGVIDARDYMGLISAPYIYQLRVRAIDRYINDNCPVYGDYEQRIAENLLIRLNQLGWARRYLRIPHQIRCEHDEMDILFSMRALVRQQKIIKISDYLGLKSRAQLYRMRARVLAEAVAEGLIPANQERTKLRLIKSRQENEE
ncbi:hypothetical protein [Oryzomonas rubra]|uniref:Uncharacterized protein n=1 Tax=Oryzomonas rubra TaxID=2509454 RepID=A0A5A9X7C4_9BACT|nr:hypothetical protein [Oryzomonas rubra]KAA0888099.1 hypothetical protein ET418_17005 [Oryzomonas rubra]